MPECRTCGTEILWATLTSGELNPLEPEEMDPDVGMIAFNPRTRYATVVRKRDMHLVEHWRKHGITFHRSHFRSPRCKRAEQVNAGQGVLL